MSTASLAASLERPAPNRRERRATAWCRDHGISLQTFHRWRLKPNGPPCRKLFGVWHVDDDEMDDWIASRSQRPTAAPALTSAEAHNRTPQRQREIRAAIAEAHALMGRPAPNPAA